MAKWVKPTIVFLFVVSALADVITTLIALGANESTAMRESNPLVVNLGFSIWGLIIFKMLLIGYMSYLFYRPKQTSERGYFWWMLIIFYMTLTQFAVSAGNYEVYEHADEYLDAPVLSAQEMNHHYSALIIQRMFVPLFMAITPFLLWEWSVKENNYKRRRLLTLKNEVSNPAFAERCVEEQK